MRVPANRDSMFATYASVGAETAARKLTEVRESLVFRRLCRTSNGEEREGEDSRRE